MRNLIKKLLVYLNYIVAVFIVLADISVYISPGDIWPAAFFGLAFPFLMFINLAYFIYWIVTQKREFLISLIALLLSINNIHNTVQISQSNQEESNKEITERNEKTVKVLTYNVQVFNLLGRNTFGDQQKQLFQFINKENPDLICFQEFYTSINKNLPLQKINKLLSDYPYRHIEWIKRGGSSNYGIAIYSKYPIIQKMKLSFQNTNNSTIFSDVVLDADTLRVFNNHLQSIKFDRKNYRFISNQSDYTQSEKLKEIQNISFRLRDAFIKRAEQAKHLSGEIKNSPYPVIVCGDFNDTPVSYTYRKIKSGLKDAFLESGRGFGSTYEGKFPSYRIDYILHGNSLRTAKYSVDRIKFSDHYPVMAEIYIN